MLLVKISGVVAWGNSCSARNRALIHVSCNEGLLFGLLWHGYVNKLEITLFFEHHAKEVNFVFYSNIKLLLKVLNLICCLTASAKWRKILYISDIFVVRTHIYLTSKLLKRTFCI